MSVEAIVWALGCTDVRGTDKLVLIGLANHADPHGHNCWPAVSTLAKYASVTKRNVQRSLARLEESGFISVEHNRGGTSDTPSDRRPNRYTLNLSTGVAEVTPRGVARVTQRGGACDTHGVADAPLEPSLNHQRTARTVKARSTFLPGTGWIQSEGVEK